jgi:tctex1 domain-containing protein 2
MKKQAAPAPQNTEYQIKPKQREKFKPAKTKEILQEIMSNTLKDKTYSHDKAQEFSRFIADDVKSRLKNMNLPRYKFLVQVTVGEQKGQGVRVGTKCFWDYDTDYCTSEVFQNDSLFCLCVVYAVYLY